MIGEEQKSGARIIHRSHHFVSFVPFAAISPFHMWLMPLRHTPDFGMVTDEELTDLSSHIRRLMRKVYFGLDDPDYNLVVRTGARAIVRRPQLPLAHLHHSARDSACRLRTGFGNVHQRLYSRKVRRIPEEY